MDEIKFKRPNTKGMVSRRFRCTKVAVRIINAKSEEARTVELSFVDKADPIQLARGKIRLAAGEMILRTEITEDKYVIAVQSPEEFLFNSRILEYIPIQEEDQNDDSRNQQ